MLCKRNWIFLVSIHLGLRNSANSRFSPFSLRLRVIETCLLEDVQKLRNHTWEGQSNFTLAYLGMGGGGDHKSLVNIFHVVHQILRKNLAKAAGREW